MVFSVPSFLEALFLLTSFCASGSQAAAINKRAAPAGVPQFALDYAPVFRLHSTDPYRPSDIGSILPETQPEVNFMPITSPPNPLTLDNLNLLNNLGGESIYLTGKKDVATDTNQPWLKGVAPDANGQTQGATSAAILVHERDADTTDVFYFTWYNYNAGPPVIGIKFGDHVGDWEHIMIRFKKGYPEALWYSQHEDGQAYTYAAVRKEGKRPIAYSSSGSHAIYATPGDHDHTIPNFAFPGAVFLVDRTNDGPRWDPTLAAYYYKYNGASHTVTPYDSTTPVNWLYFNGKWGDQQYPVSHKNQYVLFGQARFSNGPSGPLFKDLNRSNICPSSIKNCWIRPFLFVKKSEIENLTEEV